jgi:hypothetical protein
MQVTTYGLDVAKSVMQLHWVDMETSENHRKQLKRQALLEFFVNRQPGIMAMEACGSAHYWARELRKLGHEDRLVATQFVRHFVKTNKNDAADAAAIRDEDHGRIETRRIWCSTDLNGYVDFPYVGQTFRIEGECVHNRQVLSGGSIWDHQSYSAID